MAVTVSALDVVKSDITETLTLTVSAVAGTHVAVLSQATCFFHTNGLGADWAISDDASTNSITWTQRHLSVIDRRGLDDQIAVYVSDEITANETFDITLDAHSGTSTYYWSGVALGVSGGDGTFVQVASNYETNPTDGNVTFKSTPSGYQTLTAFTTTGLTATWDTPPTGFADISGTDTLSGNGCQTGSCESSTNTSTTLNWSADNFDEIGLVAIEWAEASAGFTVQVHDGTSFVDATLSVHDGTSFVSATTELQLT